MSRMTPVGGKKRKVEDAMRGKTSKPRKSFKKQKNYHSSEDEDEDIGFAPVNLGDSDDENPSAQSTKKLLSTKDQTPYKPRSKPLPESKAQPNSSSDDSSSDAESNSDSSSETDEADVAETLAIQEPFTTAEQEATAQHDQKIEDKNLAADKDDDSSDSDDSDSDLDSQPASGANRGKVKSKRNDPSAFANSISKILSTKLSTSQRTDPVLARSIEAAKARAATNEAKLDAKAVAKLRTDKRLAKQKGRVTDVWGTERGISGEVAEKEKALRKIATKGVIQLFNAFRAAHDRAEEVRREERRKGTVGMGERERKVNESSKEGFLELITKKRATAGQQT